MAACRLVITASALRSQVRPVLARDRLRILGGPMTTPGTRLNAIAIAAAAVGVLAAGKMAATQIQQAPSDSSFAASYIAAGVTNVSATSGRVSCYAPEVTYFGLLMPADGYPGGGMTTCPGATTGEQTNGFATQDLPGRSNPAMLAKDMSESDIRVDPRNPNHIIGTSKWFVSAEGYNHLLGFYESWDGGRTWPVAGHVPGYEGWTDNTDPVGAFDPWGNFYVLLLPYEFVYAKDGGHVFNNGSNQANPSQPPETISVAVRRAGSTSATAWITTHNGLPDHVFTSKTDNANTPDKQWIAIDTNPASAHFGRVYAMFTQFILNPSRILVSYADARPDGTHTDWSAPQVLPTVPGKPWDTYLLPHVAPDGTVYTTTTNNPVAKGFLNNDISLTWSSDGGVTWHDPLPVVQNVQTPTYLNTTFSEGIVNSFGLGSKLVNGHYPLYVAYENEDPSGLSNVYLTGSFDGGQTWASPIRVNDNTGPTEALQPTVSAAPNGTVAVVFYDRRLPCPSAGDAEYAASGVAFDPLGPAGAVNYCINAAVQFYSPTLLQPLGPNTRLSQHTWDPQLNSPKRFGINGSTTFIGDYFGVDFGGGYTYTTSVSTFNYAEENPYNYQQQIVARIATPGWRR
jgi:hypothetical protein